ncbi:NAD(P)-binding domain protein [Metarhizium rileyi]|uniref:Hydroxynaphthalene reductase-like protein Arp2 n=1 Tax=Metarhizium rileyi (strain RCEF 4871) TaxID=1649241 RepID=A0A167BE49_METRR|nr:NAD(P)-binding domain protein [Metarhizium rileyi RCEF 4871]TWU72309.1 hypothetical protein ED733_004144 [Metarhizium rileyi]
MASTDTLTANRLFSLKDRVALVTGGGSGIGLMAAQALVANGARVYITGRTREKLETAKSQHFGDNNNNVIPIQADVSSKEHIQNLVKEIESREKCLCILVNNAGIAEDHHQTAEAKSASELRDSLFQQSEFDNWTNVYRTNVAAVYFTTAAFLPLLQASSERHQGWSGTVINITSISGLVKTSQHHFSYNASKAAANHVTRMLAAEIGATGLKIRVNGIAPGVFPSEMTAGESDEKQKSQLSKENFEGKLPAARPGKDEDMASAILFMAGNQYVNGHIVVVDGGYTLSAGM